MLPGTSISSYTVDCCLRNELAVFKETSANFHHSKSNFKTIYEYPVTLRTCLVFFVLRSEPSLAGWRSPKSSRTAPLTGEAVSLKDTKPARWRLASSTGAQLPGKALPIQSLYLTQIHVNPKHVHPWNISLKTSFQGRGQQHDLPTTLTQLTDSSCRTALTNSPNQQTRTGHARQLTRQNWCQSNGALLQSCSSPAPSTEKFNLEQIHVSERKITMFITQNYHPECYHFRNTPPPLMSSYPNCNTQNQPI
jgi:hypothetical protein